MAPTLDELADELYAAPPEDFVAGRERAVARARKERDAKTAAALGKLRKPTVAAWLVNLLALRQPELVDERAELSRELRLAQRELKGARLRELSAQRRAAVSALVARARSLAVAEGPELAEAKLPMAEVEATFSAALADEEIAAQVRSGRLIRAVAYAGFGEVPRPRLRLVTNENVEEDVEEETGAGPAGRGRREREEARRATAERQAQIERERERAALRKELAVARTEAKKAEAAAEQAAHAESDGAEELAAIEAELAELERRRSAAEDELGRLRVARMVADRQAAAARRRAGEVEGALEALDSSD
jgi:chromosome segregation ATPase